MRTLITATLLLTATALGAQSRLDTIAHRALQVGHVMQQERVFLHFDNTAYYLGETMWFKAYVSFGANNRPSTLSKVLYVELVAPEGYVIETKKYKINDDGSCYGEFGLSPLLLSGYYEVRAYTRYMLNWDKSAIFSRVFPIFDKINADNWDFRNMLGRERGFNDNGTWAAPDYSTATLSFFPEGGHLVCGIESKVAFELRDRNGLFCEESITIYKDREELLRATPQHYGKGVFTLTPQEGAEYTAKVTLKDDEGKEEEYKFELPEIAAEGVTVSVEERADSIDIIVRNNYSTDSIVGFAILNKGAMGFYKSFSTNEKEKRFALHKNELPEGVNRAIVFADRDIALTERQFFVMHDEWCGNDMSTARLLVTANGYHAHNLSLTPGEKITLRVTREDEKPIAPTANLSLSISDAEGMQATSYSHNLYTYLLLGSELKGYIPDAAQYFDESNPNRKEHLELVMLTHGWSSYDWRLLTRNEITSMQPIERGITLKGMFFQKQRTYNFGDYSNTIVTPQKETLTRLDIAIDGKQVTTSTFRTDTTGSFVLEFEDFYGPRIASLRPQTTFRHSKNIFYQFALDRYYSPGFRLYDYWEKHLGAPMSSSEADSLVKLNPFEYMLSSFEVVASRKRELNGRPPHSEMRFNYLDEWEYAQDVTYLNAFNTYEDELYLNLKDEIWFEQTELADKAELMGVTEEVIESGEIIKRPFKNNKDLFSGLIKYVGNIRFSSSDSGIIEFPIDHEFDHTLTANDVVLSAMRRHNYNWAYWVQLMVVLGEYSQDSVPRPDYEYLRGLPDIEKMTNFKEFVIRSDTKTREQFENRDIHWTALGRMMDNKVPVQKFYHGFLSQSYLFAGGGIDGCPDSHSLYNSITNYRDVAHPVNPNYVACLIPYTPEEREAGFIPEFTATGSTLRYTMVQGYNESKQFYSPDYSNIPLSGDDYRRTLLWVPNVAIDSTGSATIELYNNSRGNAVNISVAGRDGQIIYSNDNTISTRGNAGEQNANTPSAEANASSEQAAAEEEMTPEMERACAREHEKGVIYYNQGRYRDAIPIFAELVKYKYAPSLYYVGICYRDGTGLAHNAELAYEFLSAAAERNHSIAQYELAEYIENGEVQCDEAEVHRLYESAAALDEPRALLVLAHRYRDGVFVAQDSTEYRHFLQKSAQQQNPEALYEYGALLIAENLNGREYIKQAALLKNEAALLYMMDEEDKAANYREAYLYAKALSELGNHHGTKVMADYYYEGKGVSRDRSLAKDLYRDAANAGNEEAARILEEL